MFTHKLNTDVLVVGSGLAGIKVSKELIKQGHRVTMITKTKLASGSSFYPLKASLGTQVTKDETDESIFLDDIDALSRGMHRKDLAEIYVKEIRERIHDYPKLGVLAKRLENERKACFAPNARQVYLLSDWEQIRKNVEAILLKEAQFELKEKTVCCDIIKKDDKVVGAILLNEHNEYVHVSCKAVVLATGGFGNIYKHNLNPADVDGSGHVLALQAGAKLVNMEYIQFIPGITHPRYKTLFGEQTLEYCTKMVDENGENVLERYLPEDVSLRECLDVRSGHGPFTHTFISKYFDIAMMKEIIKHRHEDGFQLLFDEALYENDTEFFTVYLNWLREKGVDFIRDQVKIAPFAHASNGGVYIDENGSTGVNGLYAVGELASTIEGANRLGGNSTGGCLVFGERVANHCASYITNNPFVTLTKAEEDAAYNSYLNTFPHADEHIAFNYEKISDAIDDIRETMWYYGNVVRTEEMLHHALEHIENETKDLYHREMVETETFARKRLLKLRNFSILSKLLLTAMSERKESRGAHYRDDYPDEREQYKKRLFISLEQETLVYTFK